MREVVNLLAKIENYTSSRTWILKIILSDLKAGSDFLKNSDSIKMVYDAFIPLGVGIALIYFIMAIIQSVMDEEINMEIMVKNLAKTLVSILLVKNGYNMLLFITDFGQTLVNGVVDNEPLIYVGLSTDIRYSFWNTVLNFVLCVPNLLFLVSIFIVSKLIIWGRTLEIGYNIVLAPIAFGDISMKGINSNGYRFLKKFFALTMQGIIICISVYICSQMSEVLRDVSNEMSFSGFMKSFLIGIIMTKMLIQSKQLSQEIVGTR